MYEQPIIITEVLLSRYDFLEKGYPCIPIIPRKHHSLAIITDGIIRYTVEGRSVEVKKDEILFVHAGHIDLSETATDYPVRYINIDFTTMTDTFTMNYCFNVGDDRLAMQKQFAKVAQLWTEREANFQMECIAQLYLIINRLRKIESVSNDLPYHQKKIAPAIIMLNERLSDPKLKVTDLSSACNVCTPSFNRSIQRLYGMTAYKFVLSRRMEYACELLKNSTNSIGFVAKKVGFIDIYAFSHTFTRVFGTSPTAWRERMT